MTIRTRLFVQGALVPAVAIAVLVVGGGLILRSALLRAVDESLTTQAAIEAISVFDSELAPHLHLHASPIRSEVAAYAPSRAVYGPRGNLLVVEEGPVPMSQSVEPPDRTRAGRPALVTRADVAADERVRELRLVVMSPAREPHLLVLRSGLGRIAHTLAAYYQIMALGGALVIAVLVAVQVLVSKRWASRIRNMTEHMRRVEEGDLASRPLPDTGEDEIGELTVAVHRATERLEAARSARDRLIAYAAHELRTPLAAMRTEVDVTLRRPREPGELREALGAVREEVVRLDHLTAKLLELARFARDDWRFERGDPRGVVEAVIAHLSDVAQQKGITLALKNSARIDACFDVLAVRQAIENLLTNAIKFSPEGGRVTVELESVGEGWSVAIQDEGPGVPLEQRHAVFDAFHRLDARIPGSGLGLAIVRDVAHGHRGRVWFEDAPRGARVSMALPRTPEPQRAA